MRHERGGRRVPSDLAFRLVLVSTMLLAMVGATVLLPERAGAAGINVTAIDDTYDLSQNCNNAQIAQLPGPNGVVSLREAICTANNTPGADEITFTLPGSAPWTISLTAGFLRMESDITITGPGATELIIERSSAAGPTRVINATSGTSSISGLTIRNGLLNTADGSDGAGLRNAGTLTLDRVIVSGNSILSPGTGGAGGIYNDNSGTLTIKRSTISGNTASGSGGGISNNSGTLTVEESTVTTNSSTGNNGGGINNVNSGKVTIRRSTVVSNTAIGDGGGLFSNSSSTVTIEESTFNLNSTTAGNGGGITLNNGTATVTNSTIANNTAATGGGIYARQTTNGATTSLTLGAASGGSYTATGTYVAAAANPNFTGSVSSGSGNGSFTINALNTTTTVDSQTTVYGNPIPLRAVTLTPPPARPPARSILSSPTAAP